MDLIALLKGKKPQPPSKAAPTMEEEGDEEEGDDLDQLDGPELEKLHDEKVAAKDWSGAYEVRKRLVHLCSDDGEGEGEDEDDGEE
jgi:hypothetical protein